MVAKKSLDQNNRRWGRTTLVGVALVALSLIWLALILRQKNGNTEPPFPKPHTFEQRPLVLKSARMFRQSLSRAGQSSENLRTPVRLFKRILPLNVNLHSASKSSPVTDESGIYLGTDTGRFIKVTWQGDIAWEFQIASPRGIHGSAVVSENDVWIGAYNGRIYRLDKATGRPLWMNTIGETIGSSPLLIGRNLFVTVEWNDRPNGGLVKLNAESGEVMWQTPLLGEQIHSSPSFDEKNNAIVFGANHGALFSFDADTGNLRWIRYTGDSIKSTPAIADGQIFISSWDGFLRSVSGVDGEKIWQAPLNEASQSSPTLIPELNQVIVGDDFGNVRSFRMDNGKLLWTKVMEGSVVGSATVFRSGKEWRIAIGCQTSNLCLFDDKGNLLQELETRSPVSGEPNIFGGKLSAASDRHGLWVWE